MKTKAFQTKRRAKAGFRFLHAKTKKRKQRVAAAANHHDFAVEEPNLGVARALVVILLLHLAAIAAIVVHHNTTKGDLAVTDGPKGTSSSQSKALMAGKEKPRPQIGTEDDWYWVRAGDTYERIARKEQVDVDELRRLNDNHALVGGMALIIPPEQPAEPAQVLPAIGQRNGDAIIQASLPPIQDVAPSRRELPAEYQIVDEGQSADEPAPFPAYEGTHEPQTVRAEQLTNRQPAPGAPEQTLGVNEQPQPQPASESYTVRDGDTMWAIANRNGISVDELVAANRNVDPRKMRPGVKLSIPAN